MAAAIWQEKKTGVGAVDSVRAESDSKRAHSQFFRSPSAQLRVLACASAVSSSAFTLYTQTKVIIRSYNLYVLTYVVRDRQADGRVIFLTPKKKRSRPARVGPPGARRYVREVLGLQVRPLRMWRCHQELERAAAWAFTCKIGFDTAENEPRQVCCMIRAREF